MKNDPTTIISFFARGREIGFVVIEGGQVVRYGVKTIKGKRQGSDSIRSVERALWPLIETLESQGMIVVERHSASSRTGILCQVMGILAKRWKRAGYPTSIVSLETVKRSLCETRKAKHIDILKVMMERYPFFRPLIPQPKAAKAKYWKKVLLALALADVVKRRSDCS